MAKFKYVSLFSGIGGFEQALNKLGGTCVLASEIDKFAQQSYKALYGDAHLHEDITKIDAKDVPDHDLLVGGFPCQSFSVAGKRKGFDDTRGTLFFEIARIASTKQPSALLLENVKGLVNHDKGRTLDVMVETLNEIGYTVDFNVLNSKYFGVPQNRERIFIIAVRDDLITQEAWEDTEGQTVVPKGKRRISSYEWAKTFNFDWPEESEVTTRLRDILETEVDEKYYLDEEKTARLVAQLESHAEASIIQLPRGHNKGGQHELSPTVTSNYFEGNNLLSEPQMLGHIDINGHDAIRRVDAPAGISPTLTTMGGGHREPKIAEEQEPKLSIVGHSGSGGQKGHIYDTDGLISTLTATDYKQPKQIAQEIRPVLTPERAVKRQNGRRFKEDGEESFTLTSQDRHGVAEGCPPRYRIRKLTPLECWRLQGFSDLAHETVKLAGVSDSQRYKQAGNAVTANVIEAIGERLIPLISAQLERQETLAPDADVPVVVVP